MGVISEIQSGDELTLLVNSGICAHIEFILKESGKLLFFLIPTNRDEKKYISRKIKFFQSRFRFIFKNDYQ